jgi:hypothetical protein
MTQSVGSNPIDGTSEDKLYTLAQVLQREFEALHPESANKLDASHHESINKKEQMPLADPSLKQTDDRARGQHPTLDKIEKAPSQQLDPDDEADLLRSVWQNVHKLPGDGRTALCLSGGGVRSAAFNLGVLQGLARLGLLNRFHYLSTVSGGGYIGCWLSAWRHRSEKGISDILRGLSWPDRFGDAQITPRVPHAISNLRRSTNYLTPTKGVLSPDSWTTAVIVSRNLILNHLVIVPLVAALLLIVKLTGVFSYEQSVWEWLMHIFLTETGLQDSVWAQYLGTFLLPGIFAAIGWIIFSVARPSWADPQASSATESNSQASSATESKSQASSATKCKSKDGDGKPDAQGFFARRWNGFLRWWKVFKDTPTEIQAPRLGMVFVLAGALLFGFIVAKSFPESSSWSWERISVFPIGGAVGSLFGFVLAFLVARIRRKLSKKVAEKQDEKQQDKKQDKVTVPTAGVPAVFFLALAAFAAGGAGGFVLGIGEELAAYLPKKNPTSTALVVSIAPLWFVISYNAGDAVFLGLTARKPHAKGQWCDQWGDEEREWIARIGGYLTVIAVGFSMLFLLTLFSPIFIKSVKTFPWTGPFGIAMVVILSALASIGLAASPFSTHFGSASRGIRLPVRQILAVTTPVFAGLLVALLSTGIDRVLFETPLLDFLAKPYCLGGGFDPTTARRYHFGLFDPTTASVRQYLFELTFAGFDPTIASGRRHLLGLAFLLAAFSLSAARFVNINRFSLYDLYRNRLTSEFLGASNMNRTPEVWTGLDEDDDIPLDALWPPRNDLEMRLYPVINATLNMAAGERLEWQERKGVSFVFTPLYCGSGATHDLGFRDTKDYANGIRLGWAMSISGAAVSPNAGYSTMPGLALLMTLFNLRLGVWAGNPGAAGGESHRLRGPVFALRPLLSEAFAQTNDKSKYVYLCLSKIKSEHIRGANRRGLGGKEYALPSSRCAIGARPYPRPSGCASHYSSERKISESGADVPRLRQ